MKQGSLVSLEESIDFYSLELEMAGIGSPLPPPAPSATVDNVDLSIQHAVSLTPILPVKGSQF